MPQSAAPASATATVSPSTTSRRPCEGDRGGRAEDDDATEAVERTTAEEPPDGHRRDEDPEGDGSDRLRRAVPVHERDGDPVVRRPLREREGENEQPHDDRPPLAPGGCGARACAARHLVRRGDGDELPHGEKGDDGDERADGKELHGEWKAYRRRDGTERRAAHRAEAEGRMEPRHERAAQTPLDVGALDVHRDVPDTHPEPGHRKADRGRDDGSREEADREREETDLPPRATRRVLRAQGRPDARSARRAGVRQPRPRRGRGGASRARLSRARGRREAQASG